MSFTASQGVQCSSTYSLFSSSKRRMSPSKTVHMPWLSKPGYFVEPSPFSTGFGPRLMSGNSVLSMSVPGASALDRRGIWLWNSETDRKFNSRLRNQPNRQGPA